MGCATAVGGGLAATVGLTGSLCLISLPLCDFGGFLWWW